MQSLRQHPFFSAFKASTVVSAAEGENTLRAEALRSSLWEDPRASTRRVGRETTTGNMSAVRRLCLPSTHEFSPYIFCWIAFYAFITFDYRYTFYSRLSYNIQTNFPNKLCFDLSNAFGSLVSPVGKHSHCQWTLPKSCLLPSSSFTISGKTIRRYCHVTDLNN